MHADVLRILTDNKPVTFTDLVRLAGPHLQDFTKPNAKWWENDHINQVLTVVLNELFARQEIEIAVT